MKAHAKSSPMAPHPRRASVLMTILMSGISGEPTSVVNDGARLWFGTLVEVSPKRPLSKDLEGIKVMKSRNQWICVVFAGSLAASANAMETTSPRLKTLLDYQLGGGAYFRTAYSNPNGPDPGLWRRVGPEHVLWRV